jgi:hypothetical protein
MSRALGLGVVVLAVALTVTCHSHPPVGPTGPEDAAADGTTSDVAAPDTRAEDTCTAASDCTFGELDHDILSPSDCVCLIGCGSIPQTKATAQRRLDEHAALCDPRHDAQGNPCPVDDCILPPPLTCTNGRCTLIPAL